MKKVIDYYLIKDDYTDLWKLKIIFHNNETSDIELYNTNCYCLMNATKVAERMVEDWLQLDLVEFENEYDGFDNHIQI